MKTIKCDTIYGNWGLPICKCQFLVDEKEIAVEDFNIVSMDAIARMTNIVLEFLDLPSEPHIPFFKKEIIKK